MPFAKQIEIEHVSIIPSASPIKENQPAIMTKTENAVESRGDEYECQEIASSSLSYQFDQWDALADREEHEAYSIQTKFSKKEEICRGKLCDWCYSIVDGYELDRSTAAVAMSYFDRLVPRTKGRYWILSIAACLNIAIKVNSYGGQMISPKKMAELASTIMSNNDKSYSSGDILKMEIYVLEELDWFVNPPVPQTFLDIISPILTHSPMCQYDFDDEDNVVIDGEVRHILCQTAQFLCELSVFDVFFSTENPSAIAIAALLVALDVMQFPAGASKWVLSLPLDCNLDELNIYAQRLHKLHEHEGNGPQCTYWSNSSTGEGSDEGRPRTITPLKDEMPPSIKRCREDTIEARSIEGKAAEGNTTNASKKRKIK